MKNDLEFTASGETFQVGEQTLNGSQALKYSRMRYDDPRGDSFVKCDNGKLSIPFWKKAQASPPCGIMTIF